MGERDDKGRRGGKGLISIVVILAVIFNVMILLSVLISIPWVRIEIHDSRGFRYYDFHPFKEDSYWSNFEDERVEPLMSEWMREKQSGIVHIVSFIPVAPPLALIAIFIGFILMKLKHKKAFSLTAVVISLFSCIYGFVSLVPLVRMYLWIKNYPLYIMQPWSYGMGPYKLESYYSLIGPFLLCLVGCISSIVSGFIGIWLSRKSMCAFWKKLNPRIARFKERNRSNRLYRWLFPH